MGSGITVAVGSHKNGHLQIKERLPKWLPSWLFKIWPSGSYMSKIITRQSLCRQLVQFHHLEPGYEDSHDDTMGWQWIMQFSLMTDSHNYVEQVYNNFMIGRTCMDSLD